MIPDSVDYYSAFIAEMILTYLIILVIFQTACTNGDHGEALAKSMSSPIAVGNISK